VRLARIDQPLAAELQGADLGVDEVLDLVRMFFWRVDLPGGGVGEPPVPRAARRPGEVGRVAAEGDTHRGLPQGLAEFSDDLRGRIVQPLGAVQAAFLLSTAFGPLLLGLGYDVLGSYDPVIPVLMGILVIGAILIGPWAPTPIPPSTVSTSSPRETSWSQRRY